MKSTRLVVAGLLFYGYSYAQIGINTTTPAATLHIQEKTIPDNTDGLIIPRLDNFPSTNPEIDQDGMLVFITGHGTDERGFYFWDYDNSYPKWNPINKGSDIDWYKTGTTATPSTIDDNLYTKGSLSINSTAINNAINIEQGYADVDAFILNKATGNDSNIQVIGVHNDFEGAPEATIRAFKNSFSITTNENQYGLDNTFASTGTSSLRIGVNNTFNNGGGVSMGVQNVFPTYNTNSGIVRGVFNNILTAANGTHYGTQSVLNGTSNAIKYGVHNELSGTGNGTHYGIYNTLSGSGTGTKYGSYSKIVATAGGTHYAVYGEATKSTGYAGYFVGKISIGHSFSNRYTLPEEDGETNQILMTDGNGTTRWETLASSQTASHTVLCNAALSANQTIFANQYQKINFNTILLDTFGNFTTENNAFIATLPGYYKIQTTFKGQTINNENPIIQLALYKNGEIIEERFIENSQAMYGILETVILIDTEDVIEVFIKPSNTIIIQQAPHHTSFKIEKL